MAESVTISERAARRIGEILKDEPAGSMLRVSVEGGGCSGFQYKFGFDAAHYLELAPSGSNRRLHGHSFYAEVTLRGQTDAAKGWVRAFKGHLEDKAIDEVRYKEGDEAKFSARAESTDKLLVFATKMLVGLL